MLPTGSSEPSGWQFLGAFIRSITLGLGADVAVALLAGGWCSRWSESITTTGGGFAVAAIAASMSRSAAGDFEEVRSTRIHQPVVAAPREEQKMVMSLR